MTQHNITATKKLVNFAQHLYQNGLRNDIREKIKQLIIDQFGVQLGSTHFTWSKAVYQYHHITRAFGKASIIVSGEKTSVEQAAFINSTYGHAQDFDDTCLEVQTHPGAVVIPVGLAMAEEVNASGEQTLRAIAAGIEIMLRIAHSVSPGCLMRGHHTPQAVGPFGAAITAGLLLGLNESQLINSVGIAGSFSGGLTEYTQSGGSVKRIHTAIPTTAGIRAAYFAKFQLTGPSSVLEGKKGFCNVYSDTTNLNRLTEGLYEQYLISHVALKYYNCCYFIHAPLEATLNLVKQNNIVLDNITKIKIGACQHSTIHVGKIIQPTDELGAQFSTSFTISLALLKETPDLYSYTPERLRDPAILAFAKKISMYEDNICSKEYPQNWGAIVTIFTKDNQKFQKRLRYPKGTINSPMTIEDIQQKFMRNTTKYFSECLATKIFNISMNLEKCCNISELTHLLVSDVLSQPIVQPLSQHITVTDERSQSYV